MIDFIEVNYQDILAHNFTHLYYTMYLFDALLASKNDIFYSMIQRLKDSWEIVENSQPNILIKATVIKYNNMVKQKLWDQIDPKNVKKIVITTKLEVLESDFSIPATKHPRGGTRGSGGTHNQNQTPFIIPDWKNTKKEDIIKRDGETLHWCKHHVHTEILWDGLYISHKQEYHD